MSHASVMERIIVAYGIGFRFDLLPSDPVSARLWAEGDRSGEVVKITRTYIYSKMDQSGRIMRSRRVGK